MRLQILLLVAQLAWSALGSRSAQPAVAVAPADRWAIVRDGKAAIAGGLAGAVATASLHPLDTAKTIKQANPGIFAGSWQAVQHVCKTKGPLALYAGVGTAIIGSMPSSALYFGAYEGVKRRLNEVLSKRWEGCPPESLRAPVSMVAAICGNAASSIIFAPKEFIKQSLQVSNSAGTGAAAKALPLVSETIRTHGVQGLYRGYFACLKRNIPSAVLRFTLYEEFKVHLGDGKPLQSSPKLLIAGALAGAIASGLTTPLDVLKTQVSTGRLPGDLGTIRGLTTIAQKSGWKSLYAGVQPRIVMSAMFTAIGFSSFDFFKHMLDPVIAEEAEVCKK
ncbi:unnamed protein product [Chrysoparadoxa australica]